MPAIQPSASKLLIPAPRKGTCPPPHTAAPCTLARPPAHLRVQDAKCQVLQLGLEAPHAQAVGHHGIHLERLSRQRLLALARQRPDRAHVVDAVGQLDQHGAHVLHRHQHAAELVLAEGRGGAFAGALLRAVQARHLADVGHAVDEADHGGRHELLQLAAVQVPRQHLVQQPGRHRLGVQPHARKQLGDLAAHARTKDEGDERWRQRGGRRGRVQGHPHTHRPTPGRHTGRPQNAPRPWARPPASLTPHPIRLCRAPRRGQAHHEMHFNAAAARARGKGRLPAAGVRSPRHSARASSRRFSGSGTGEPVLQRCKPSRPGRS